MFCHVSTCDRGICVCIIWWLDKYPSHHVGGRVPLKDCDREQVTITVQVARSYSLSTCWGDLGKDTWEQRRSIFLAETSTVQDTPKRLSSWLCVPRHTIYLHLISSWTIGAGKTLHRSLGYLQHRAGDEVQKRSSAQGLHCAQSARVQGYVQQCTASSTISSTCWQQPPPSNTSHPFSGGTKALNTIIPGPPM